MAQAEGQREASCGQTLSERRLSSYYFYQEEYDKALADFEKAGELDPENPLHSQRRGQTFANQDNHEAASGDR